MLRVLTHFLFIFLLINSSNSLAADESSANVKWGYSGKIGPAYWGHLTSEFALCANGKSQSPINIAKKVPKSTQSLTLNYDTTPFDIIDDGTTDLNINGKRIITNTGHGIQINFQNHPEEIILDDNRYKLIQFHFHTPSENLLAGQSFPVEIHFVHQGQNGQVAVLGVFVKEGKENSTLQKINDHLPKDVGIAHSINETINPLNLIPKNKSFFHFMGSLTTPPCSEGLEWIVLQQPIEASAKQILQLRKAMGKNVRPIQALNQRKITFSAEKK